LTQLLLIRQENKVAQAEVAASQSDLRKAELEVTLKVHEIYYALLIAQLNRQAAQQQVEYAEEGFRESSEDVKNGSALRVAEIGSRAGLLESKQSLLTVELQISDLTYSVQRPARTAAWYEAETRPGSHNGRCCSRQERMSANGLS
jgi:outer membrane protein TolC